MSHTHDSVSSAPLTSKFSWWEKWIVKKKKFATTEKFMDEDKFMYACIGQGLPPIYQQTTFAFDSVRDGKERFLGVSKNGELPFARVYTRLGNPTTEYLEKALFKIECGHILEKSLQEGEHEPTMGVLVTSSGMGAISTVLMSLLDANDEIINGTVYGCTNSLLHSWGKKYGIKTHLIDTTDLPLVEKTLSENPKIKCVYVESPENPTMRLNDLEGLAALTEMFKIPLVVDNTFASPYLQQPFRLGADIIVHSLTKYINGHSTSIGGALLGPWEYMLNDAFPFYKDLGSTPSPFDSWLTSQNLQDLAIRVTKQSETALSIAEFLEKHPLVKRVWYPFLPSNPQYQLAKKQMRMGGGVISFELKGGYEEAIRMMDFFGLHTSPMKLAVSLGCAVSYIQHPASMTHSGVPPEEREKMGISDGLIRISIGLEGYTTLSDALNYALELAHAPNQEKRIVAVPTRIMPEVIH